MPVPAIQFIGHLISDEDIVALPACCVFNADPQRNCHQAGAMFNSIPGAEKGAFRSGNVTKTAETAGVQINAG